MTGTIHEGAPEGAGGAAVPPPAPRGAADGSAGTPGTAHGGAVRLVGLRRSFGTVRALDGFDLDIAPGELVALLGPSGCGKTTALRVLAGLEDLDSGQVLVDGTDITAVPANHRDMGMVFQAYSLFPHLTAYQNVEFGLRLRRVGAAERRGRVGEMLDLVGIAEQADRFPHQMSGGQQQRVALARALAIRPRVLLLDEPLSALDAKVRVQLRDEIRRVQTEVGITTLFVTHDQEEALALADRVGVMRDGHLQQIGPPDEIYRRPASAFVADFVGLSNRMPRELTGAGVRVLDTVLPLVDPASAPTGGAVVALVRPEAVQLLPATDGSARVIATSFSGATSRVTVRLPDGTDLVAQIDSAQVGDLATGTAVRVALRPVPVVLAEG